MPFNIGLFSDYRSLRFLCGTSVAALFYFRGMFMNIKPIGDTINERIANYRKRAGYTQKDIADAFNMKVSTYSQKERNSEITCDFALRIAKFLDIDVRCLLFGDEQYSNKGFLDADFNNKPIDEPTQIIPKVNIEGRTLYYLSGQQISVIKMLSFFPKKYRQKAIDYINIIYNCLVEKKLKRNKK